LFLNFCKNIGAKTFGIDPAVEVSKIAKKNKHKILLDYLNIKSLKNVPNKIIIILAWRFKDKIFKKIKKLDKISKVITVNPSINKISFL